MVFLVAMMVILVSFARLLFYQYVKIFLQHIRSSLQPQTLAYKRGFEQDVMFVEGADVSGKYFMDKRADVTHLCLSLRMKVVGKLTRTKLQRRRCEKLSYRVRITYRSVFAFVDIVVQKLAGEVT